MHYLKQHAAASSQSEPSQSTEGSQEWVILFAASVHVYSYISTSYNRVYFQRV